MSGSEAPRARGRAGPASRHRDPRLPADFNLADHVKVAARTSRTGCSRSSLKREVPEALKPRRIEIASGGPKTIGQDNAQQIEHEPRRAKAA